jgi:hypothetical protein
MRRLFRRRLRRRRRLRTVGRDRRLHEVHRTMDA